MREPSRIGDILPAVLAKTGRPAFAARKTGDWESTWSRAVEERLRAHSYVERCAGQTLVVRVDGSAYAAEMNLRKAELLELLRRESGRRLRTILFIV